MSGRTIGTLAGAAIGFAFPVIGVSLGATAGGIIGGLLDPPTLQGAQFQGGSVAGSQHGLSIPIVFATYRVVSKRGLDGEDQPRVFKVKEKAPGGKGSPKVERDEALLNHTEEVCESSELRGTSVHHVLACWEDEVLVYDVRPGSQLSAADNAKWLANKTIRYGREDQGPSPMLEAIHGVGNVPAYRGLLTVDIVDDSLMVKLDGSPRGGRLPVREYLVSACGVDDVVEPPADEPAMWVALGSRTYLANDDGGEFWNAEGQTASISARYVETWNRRILILGDGSVQYSDDQDQTRTSVSAPWGMNPINKPCKTSSGRIYVTDNTTNLYYTDDGGATWFTVALGFTAGLIAGDDDGLLIHTSGTNYRFGTIGSWASRTAPITIDKLGYGAGMFMIGGAITDNYWSEDACVSWTLVSLPSPGGDKLEAYSLHRTATGAWLALNRINGATTNELIARSPDGKAPFVYVTTPSAQADSAGSDHFAEQGDSIVCVCRNGAGQVVFLRSTSDGNGWVVLTHSLPSGPSAPAKSIAVTTAPPDPIYTGDPIPDAPGYYISPTTGETQGPSLTETTTGCTRPLDEVVRTIYKIGARQLDDDHFDLSALAGRTVRGYMLNDLALTAADAVEPLRRVYTFDLPDFDKKIRAVPRGGPVNWIIDPADIIQGEGPAIEDKRGLTLEYPRKVHVHYTSPALDYKQTSQVSESTSPDVRVNGEEHVNTFLVLSDDEAAQAAHIIRKVMTAEREHEQTFALPLPFIGITAADILSVAGKRLRVDAMRIERTRVVIERGVHDRASAVSSTVAGSPGTPPPPPPGNLFGPSLAVLMNVPALDDSHDRPGMYWAVRGYPGTRWPGAYLQVLRSGTWVTLDETSIAANIGTLLQNLPASTWTVDDVNPLVVQLPGEFDTVDYETWLNEGNPLAVLNSDATAEILQPRVAVEDPEGTYTCTQIIRGRLDTQAGEHLADARVVVLDDSVRFVPLTVGDIGTALTFRVVTMGTDPDAAPTQVVTFGTMESVREWQPQMVQWERDGSDNLLVTWVGRGRLGTDAFPEHSEGFRGYLVTVEDGTTTKSWQTTDEALVVTSADQIGIFGSDTFTPTLVKVVALSEVSDVTDAGTPYVFPTGLAGWIPSQAGWSESGGVATYDPTVSGEQVGFIYLNDPQPFAFGSGAVFRGRVFGAPQPGSDIAAGAVGCAFLNSGTYRGGAAGTLHLFHSVIEQSPVVIGNQVAVALYAFTDGVTPIDFSELTYSVTP